jgi:hypothetical protein
MKEAFDEICTPHKERKFKKLPKVDFNKAREEFRKNLKRKEG